MGSPWSGQQPYTDRVTINVLNTIIKQKLWYTVYSSFQANNYMTDNNHSLRIQLSA